MPNIYIDDIRISKYFILVIRVVVGMRPFKNRFNHVLCCKTNFHIFPNSLLAICFKMSVRPSCLMVFVILTVLLLGLEAKPLHETFDVSEDFNLNEAPRHLMEEKRNRGSSGAAKLQRFQKAKRCNRFLPQWFC